MLTRSEISRALSADPSTVRRWQERGLPSDSLEAVKAWHSSNIRQRRKRREAKTSATGGDDQKPAVVMPCEAAADPPTRSWRDRLDKANARTRETQLAQLRGELVNAQSMWTAIINVFSVHKARLRSIPSALAPRVAMVRPAVAHTMMLAELDATLNDLADMLDGIAPARVREGK